MSVEERLARIERLVMLGAKSVLDTAEIALMLGVSESRVRHLVCERKIPYYKQGRSVYFKKSEVEDWMLERRVPTDEEIMSEAAGYAYTK